MMICPECLARHPPEWTRCPVDGAALLALGFGDARIGELVQDRYLILDVLGQGGMGIVYLAWQRAMARKVALKMLYAAGPARDALAKRFVREARATAALRSPHTVTVHDFGELADGALFLAMEHLEGATLDRIVDERGPLAPATARIVAMQVCESLAEAHRAGIIHRDLKPANIALGRSPAGAIHAKVLDFGIAKVVEDESTELTATGATVGSVAYMSPEQIDGREIGPGADLYSLGVTLYDVLTDSLPFDAPNKLGLMFKHLSEPPPHLPERLGTGPAIRALDAVIRRCLGKTPEERYPSADALRAALAAVPLDDAPTEPDAPRRAAAEPRRAELDDTMEGTTAPPLAATQYSPGPQPQASPMADGANAHTPAEPLAPRRFPLWLIPAAFAAALLLYVLLDPQRGAQRGAVVAADDASAGAAVDAETGAGVGADAGAREDARAVAEARGGAGAAADAAAREDVRAVAAESEDARANATAGAEAAAGVDEDAGAAATVDAGASAGGGEDAGASAGGGEDAGASAGGGEDAGASAVIGASTATRAAPRASVIGSTPEAAAAAGQKLLGAVRRCYTRHETGGRTLEPIVLLTGDGRVSRVDAPRNTAFQRCLEAAAKAHAFEPPGRLGFVRFRVEPR
jgi:serine/threonine-protein kinase